MKSFFVLISTFALAFPLGSAATIISPARPFPPLPPPPPPPEEPDVEQYKAKFAFEGQPGEMTLKKDDIVELVEKTDNGWWLVKMNGSEGWAPNNYLELVPPKPKARPAAAPPPPPPLHFLAAAVSFLLFSSFLVFLWCLRYGGPRSRAMYDTRVAGKYTHARMPRSLSHYAMIATL